MAHQNPKKIISFGILQSKENLKMSIYILEDYIKVCRVLEIEPSWEGLKKWKKEMWRD